MHATERRVFRPPSCDTSADRYNGYFKRLPPAVELKPDCEENFNRRRLAKMEEILNQFIVPGFRQTPSYTEHALNSGYCLRIRESGVLSFRVDIVSPTGYEIYKDSLVIRGIARRFTDSRTGWCAHVRILNETAIIES